MITGKRVRSKSRLFQLLISLLFIIYGACGMKHELVLENEERPIIHISQFGFYRGGMLEVTVNDLVIGPTSQSQNINGKIGFTIDRTHTEGVNPYPQTIDMSVCALRTDFDSINADGVNRIAFALDFDSRTVKVACSESLETVKLYSNLSSIPLQNLGYYKAPPTLTISNGMVTQQKKRRRRTTNDLNNAEKSSKNSKSDPKLENGEISESGVKVGEKADDFSKNVGDFDKETENLSKNVANFAEKAKILAKKDKVIDEKEILVDKSVGDKKDEIRSIVRSSGEVSSSCKDHVFPIILKTKGDTTSFSTQFAVYVATEESEGSYNLYFHNCGQAETSEPSIILMDLSIVEENRDKNYLSAGEIPLPALYSMMSILFFISGCFWVFILRKSKKETGVGVYKIHYLMCSLVYIKSLSLLFHAINYHSKEKFGTNVEAWAILFYVTHLIKGALLFITILLIGTGYAFVKHLLSDKDKLIFMIVIPLQILANVFEIITEESEEGDRVHTTSKIIFVAVDLLCCGAILFPVVWSIKHLQEASHTDGKAATNLRKLKLFRHFYMIVVCYIYFTRIIVNMLLKMTVPFQYKWVEAMVYEMATFIFYVLSGYKFRPAKNNPYLQLAHDSDEEMDIALTENGATMGVVKRGVGRTKKKTLKEMIVYDPNEEETDEEEEILLQKSNSTFIN